MIIIEKLKEQLEKAKQISDAEAFISLLKIGEIMTKITALGVIAALKEDKQRLQYKYLYEIVSADGIGSWSRVLDQILGTAVGLRLDQEFNEEKNSLLMNQTKESWGYKMLYDIYKCKEIITGNTSEFNFKIKLKDWFKNFTELRNDHAHNRVSLSDYRRLIPFLENSISLFIENFNLFKRQWLFIYRMNNGTVKFIKLNNTDWEGDFEEHEYVEEGIYVLLDKKAIFLSFIVTNIELNDFYVPNGRFTDKKFELISYITGKTIEMASSYFHLPVESLPKSETNGLEKLELKGSLFTNLPTLNRRYIERNEIEEKLYDALIDTRRWPIVSLRGRGGIGKTSTALAVLKRICNEDKYSAIIWFSSRDIDFNEYGNPINVEQRILTKKDISKEYAELVEHPNLKDKNFLDGEFFTQQLGENMFGRCLFVFDNFETIERPVEIFEWLENYILLPNKILITTRHREFSTDKQIEVEGMKYDEFLMLCESISSDFKIKELVTDKVTQQLYKTSQGHPYVAKILLGEIANTKSVNNISRVFEDKEHILQALFERTYDKLKPLSQKVFQVLCNWRSIIPEIALEATITCHPLSIDEQIMEVDIQQAVDELRIFSFIEILNPREDYKFINVPLAASIFGLSKYKSNPNKAEILLYTKLLQNFGASQAIHINDGIEPRIKYFFGGIQHKVKSSKEFKKEYEPIVSFICRRFNKARYFLADLYEETLKDLPAARKSLDEYLRGEVNDESKGNLWDRLANYYLKESRYDLYFQTLIEKCEYKDCTLFKLFSVAILISQCIRDGKTTKIPKEIRNEIILRLIKMIEQHNSFSKLTAGQCGYLAWLYIHTGQPITAKKIAQKGLSIEYNKKCLEIVNKYATLKS
jgi:hypothetical protein